ncbi:MAG: restriction endonuclease, partial [Desulfobaccales bacterium]
MPDYSFHTLSPIDFENLVRDLLQSEFSIRLETFKSGRDDGIDLRYAPSGDGNLIVQAKHFLSSGFRSLLSHLKNKEKSKIDIIKPNRYLLATSVPLSPGNKESIKEALAPHIKNTGDIYGKDDLNNLLGLFPKIERNNFKLWLSSTTLLEDILHSKIINQSRITLENIRDKARIYVINDSFKSAIEILKKYNYVIIAGIPGIGKTTLANMLVLHFINANYDFVDVSYDISEAYTLMDHNRPLVYLYDDFLGRTSLEAKLQKNEDHRLFKFISAIRKSKSAKLILTTREYILRQAQSTYETLNNPVFENPQCVIDLSQYTRPIRAQMLYNHLYFSNLPREYIKQIVLQAAYLNIIDHPNYNPRIIEYMTDSMWVGMQVPSKYPKRFLQNLKKPFLIWEQAFENHLSNIARTILLVLGSLPREIFLEDLKHAVTFFISQRVNDLSEKEFYRALSELQGNFISLKRDRDNDVIAFHN